MCWDRQVQPEAVRPGWVLPDEFLVGLDVEDKARSLTALVLGGGKWNGQGELRCLILSGYRKTPEGGLYSTFP